MIIVKRILTIFLALIVMALSGGLIYLNSIKTRAVPDYNAGVELERLSQPVTVYRDSFGIPHIYAANEVDLYRTVGYVMAQDRLWQMDLLRRVTTGRLSEVLDPSLVNVDQLFRALDFPSKSELVLSRTDPEILSFLEAFTDGVNQFIEKNRKRLSFEFTLLGYQPDPWEMVHSANLIGYMSWNLASGWGEEIDLFKLQHVLEESLFRELLPDLSYQQIPVIPGFTSTGEDPGLITHLDEAIRFVEEYGLQVFEASNNWAVAGSRSETGLPLMANDMHLGLMAPGIWYQMHHVVEDRLHVTGVVLPGAPFVICGHNENIAWGMTNVTVDDIDFYLETINPADTNQYLLDGKWVDMRLAEEVIHVRGSEEPEVRINRYTHRGPVVSTFRDVKDHVISVRWQGNAYSNELRTTCLLNRAGNWQEFRDALRTFTSISQNVVYADRAGNIGMQTAAGIPVRHNGGILVYPGDTSLYDWQGLVPFEELPHEYNPERGYVSSANNRTVGDDYPYYIGTWFSLPHRIGRIREMIGEKPLLDTEDFKRMLRCQSSHFARDMVPVYLEALEGQTSGIYGVAERILREWDHRMDASSAAAMIFDVMWLELVREIFHDELGDAYFPVMYRSNSIPSYLVDRLRRTGESLWCDHISTPATRESFQDNIRAAFIQTVDTLATRFGDDPATWEWGDLHGVVLKHPLGEVKIVDRLFQLNRGPFPVGGSSHTVCPYSYSLGRTFISEHGASERHIFNVADWDASLTVIPTGTSGVPASPHYLDQTEHYINNRYHRDHFSRKAVEENALYNAEFR